MHSLEEAGRLPQSKMGSVLLSMDLITEEQLEEALEIQKTDNRRLGKILVSLGYLTPDDLARALAIRLNVEYVSLSEVQQVAPDVLGIISEDVPFLIDKN
jgi:type IV pilus assembly protein PilB